MTYAQEYNYRVRRINNLVAAQQSLLADENTLDGLGRSPEKAAKKAAKRERKRLAKLEKAERKALYKLTSKKAREKMAKRTKKAKRKLSKSIRKGRATGLIAKLNKRGPVTLPLTEVEEQLRAASVAGDFLAMDQIAPFGPAALTWVNKTTMGKYRFEIQNGVPVYIPWTEFDIDNFLAGPWFTFDPVTGLARLVHPRRRRRFDIADKKKKYMKHLAKSAQKYPNTDIRHVGMIEPGVFQISHGISSTWVKIREPVMIAVAVVAAVYLGPAILQAVQSAYASASAAITGAGAGGAGAGAAAGGVTAGGTAAGTAAGIGAKATLGAKIFAGASTLSGYVNQARTVEAIVKGEEIPPPVGVSGANFGEWAFKVAQDEAIKQYGRKLTRDEENAIKREIAQLQTQLAPYTKNVPLEIPQDLPVPIQRIQVIEEKKKDQTEKMMQLAIPVIAGFLILRGVA